MKGLGGGPRGGSGVPVDKLVLFICANEEEVEKEDDDIGDGACKLGVHAGRAKLSALPLLLLPLPDDGSTSEDGRE